jgi:hypothetical protein
MEAGYWYDFVPDSVNGMFAYDDHSQGQHSLNLLGKKHITTTSRYTT